MMLPSGMAWAATTTWAFLGVAAMSGVACWRIYCMARYAAAAPETTASASKMNGRLLRAMGLPHSIRMVNELTRLTGPKRRLKNMKEYGIVMVPT